MSVKDFYKGTNILITGGTGFIGKALIEKLLRSCTDIVNIFVLVRPKKGKSLEDRIKCILTEPLFDLLKSTNSTVINKIVPISGDISKINLGLSNEDRILLIEKINVIFHAAASIKFDDPLKEAILTNIRSAQEMALLALEMKALKVFVHISTAYTYIGKEKIVPEEFHPQEGNWKDAIYIAENGDGFLINILTQKYIEGFPNTYTYTKHLAEHCIKEHLEFKIPTVILRPTIVNNSLEEPMIGWTDNLNGPVGILASCSTGILRSLFADSANRLDNISVDIVVKTIILVACKTAHSEVNKSITVMHISANNLKQYTIGYLGRVGMGMVDEIPLEKAIWIPTLYSTTSWSFYYINFILFQLIPAVFIDALLKLAGYKPFLIRIQRKVFIINIVLNHFMTNNWIFLNQKSSDVFQHISEEDKADFSFRFLETDDDVRKFMKTCLNYVRISILREDREIKPLTRKIRKIMHCLDKLVKSVFYCTCIWIVFFKLNIISVIWSYLLNYCRLL